MLRLSCPALGDKEACSFLLADPVLLPRDGFVRSRHR
jgi:hypothetical protein